MGSAPFSNSMCIEVRQSQKEPRLHEVSLHRLWKLTTVCLWCSAILCSRLDKQLLRCLKGLVTSEIYRYWIQNTEEADFIRITTNFILRLLQRGHQLENLYPLLKSAAANIEYSNIRERNEKSRHDDTMYIHWPFHPTDISKNKIRRIYNQTLQGHDGFKNLKMAISRPKNLRDILCKTDLPIIQNKNVSDILKQINSDDTRQK